MSTSTAALAAALAKVQAELPRLERDRTVEVETKRGDTYSYSYVTLANLSAAILPILARHGLAFTALPGVGADGKMCLRYHLLHDSGESLIGEFPISGEGGIQMIGGRITYARRYCLAALVGVAADEDDEGRLAGDGDRTAQRARPRPALARQAATSRAGATPEPADTGRTRQRATRPAPPPLPDSRPDAITAPQRARLMAIFGQIGIDDRAERLDISSRIVGRHLTSANELTKAEAGRLLDALDEAARQDNPQLHLAEITAQPIDEGSA